MNPETKVGPTAHGFGVAEASHLFSVAGARPLAASAHKCPRAPKALEPLVRRALKRPEGRAPLITCRASRPPEMAVKARTVLNTTTPDPPGGTPRLHGRRDARRHGTERKPKTMTGKL